jgi:hypothetical protein
MNTKRKVASLKPIEKVVRVYSGRPGCACGCRGKYWPKSDGAVPNPMAKRQIKRIYDLLQANITEVYTYTGCHFVTYEIPGRVYTMYYKD